MLARSKLNIIETLISQVLMDSNISHKKNTPQSSMKKRNKYRKTKDDIWMKKSWTSDAEKDELNEESENKQNQWNYSEIMKTHRDNLT